MNQQNDAAAQPGTMTARELATWIYKGSVAAARGYYSATGTEADDVTEIACGIDAFAAERCRGLEQERDKANKLLIKFKRCFETALESIKQYETK